MSLANPTNSYITSFREKVNWRWLSPWYSVISTANITAFITYSDFKGYINWLPRDNAVAFGVKFGVLFVNYSLNSAHQTSFISTHTWNPVCFGTFFIYLVQFESLHDLTKIGYSFCYFVLQFSFKISATSNILLYLKWRLIIDQNSLSNWLQLELTQELSNSYALLIN
jgi:hypothetical protein